MISGIYNLEIKSRSCIVCVFIFVGLFVYSKIATPLYGLGKKRKKVREDKEACHVAKSVQYNTVHFSAVY